MTKITDAFIASIDIDEAYLCLDMWTQIVHLLKNRLYVDISQVKEKFCTEHKIEWKRNCLFCDTVNNNCSECPLGNCKKDDSYYGIASDDTLTSDERIKAASSILDICTKLVNKIENAKGV